MEEQNRMSLNDKIQKLVNSYKILKQKYNVLSIEKEKLSEKTQQIEQAHATAMQQIDGLKNQLAEKNEEIEMLMEDNTRLNEKVSGYESKTKNALQQLDDVLGQLTDY
jgi:chromosome segregation ATPase